MKNERFYKQFVTKDGVCSELIEVKSIEDLPSKIIKAGTTHVRLGNKDLVGSLFEEMPKEIICEQRSYIGRQVHVVLVVYEEQ